MLQRLLVKPAWYLADHIRRVLQNGGSAPHSEDVQRFFKEVVTARGWYTRELRQVARRFSRQLLYEGGLPGLLAVADELFSGSVLEEKAMAVYLLERSVPDFGEPQFQMLEEWLSRVTTWADHDALVHSLIGPMVVQKPSRAARVLRWARSPDRWHRRAAAVAFIQGARRRMFFPQIQRVTRLLLQSKDEDQDAMAQKGLAWLLRETAKSDPRRAVPYLVRLRSRAPRPVLRTACETLPASSRARVLGH